MAEHRAVEFWAGWFAWGGSQPQKIEQISNDLGRDGWRLVNVQTQRGIHWGFWRNKVLLTFERQR